MVERWQEWRPSGRNAGNGIDRRRERPIDRAGPCEEDGALHRAGPHGIWLRQGPGRDRGNY
eukprot:12762556-Heterocapsa_arctica.AAC.1